MHPAQKILPHPIYGDHDCNKLEIRLNDNASTKVSYFLPKRFLRRTLKKKICLYSDVKKKKSPPFPLWFHPTIGVHEKNLN